MKLTELLARAGLAQISTHIEISGLSTDTRTLKPGNLFAALKSDKGDGAQFMSAAQAAGALAVLAEPTVNVPAPLVHIKSIAPRQDLAKLAKAFYQPLPQTLVAVTGTNGKTSVVTFVQQLWAQAGLAAAAIGTLGVIGPGVSRSGALTTPDAPSLGALLQECAQAGITHAALEASSHGLDQYRLDGLTLTAAGFTYLGRDHLDYHGTLAAYFAAKAQLFARLLPATGTAVLNADIPEYEKLKEICRQRGQQVLSYGTQGKELRLLKATPQATGLAVELEVLGTRLGAALAVTGAFQAHNILCALGLVLGASMPLAQALAAVPFITSAPGRLELVGRAAGGEAGVYVDYAHTPDALETVLQALRAHTRGKLVVVFGCGGNRDGGKRPLMGAIAARLAEQVIVTDDNPRFEDPALIRKAILTAAPQAQEIGDRASAIQAGLAALEAGDTLLIAGKGHEQGQIIGGQTLPFDDGACARQLLRG